MAILIVFLALVLSIFIINIFSLKKEQHDVIEQHEQLQQQKEELEKALQDTDDTENIQEQARDQLRLIKPGETLYLFPDDMTRQKEDTSSESGDQQ